MLSFRYELYEKLFRRHAMQTKMQPSKSLTQESEQATDFLKKISESLKNQRRHFDDAVVTHCIRLINDFVEESAGDVASAQAGTAGGGKRS
jgi:hypothetical protein